MSTSPFYDFKPLDAKAQPFAFSNLAGKVVLVVNVASKCGFTPQYDALEALYKKLNAQHGDNFRIIGFPCSQFGNQEPGTNEEIQEFCRINHGVSFPVLGKINVNGEKEDPVYKWLKAEKPGIMGLKMIKWNFEKFLVGADGKVVNRWASTTKPEALEEPIAAELEKVKAAQGAAPAAIATATAPAPAPAEETAKSKA